MARGFANLSKEERQRIASLGGRAAHAMGTAHEFTSEQAKAAGRAGGIARARKRKLAKQQSVQT